MAKIRVHDLAKSMRIPAQDLIFKLRSIGVRVEGDDAAIDTEVIQAILLGKKLPSPREVIMDDSPGAPAAPGAPAPAPAPAPAAPARRPPVNPLRPARPRTIIQRADGAIKTLPPSERAPGAGYPGELVAGLDGETELAPSEIFVAPPEMPVEPEAPVEAPVEAPPEVTAAPTPTPAPVAPRPIAPPTPMPTAPPPIVPRTPDRPPITHPAAIRPGMRPVGPGDRGTGAYRPAGAGDRRPPLPGAPRPGGPPRPGAPARPYTGPGARPGAPSRPGYGAGPARPGSGPGGPGRGPGGPGGYGRPRPIVTPGSRPPSLPSLRPGSPGRGAGPGSAPPTGREETRRPAPASPGSDAADRLKKLKRGIKRPTGPQVKDEDLRTFKGTLQNIEDVIDESVVPTGGVSARRRRRAEGREDGGVESARTAISANTQPDDGPLVISEGMTLRDFSERIGAKAKDLIRLLFDRGILANINFVIEPELGVKLAGELGLEAKVMTFEEEIQHRQEAKIKTEGKSSRAPVVTIMGHVDHGKTSLLDAIRSSKVVESEFGGITQHIGAYQVEAQGRKIVFLDTPGHEAFTMMRARGARATDIVVLVVAADDGVMPQTLEAINHARAAGVPIVVAVNKIDKPNANPEKVLRQLSEQGLMSEEWGGQTVTVKMSAKLRQGIDTLLEMILLTADLLELKADPELPAQGLIVEARKEAGRGIVATVLVQNGTLRVGDVFVSGATWGRVRAMSDDVGRKIAAAEPATPVEVAGFGEMPTAGDPFQVVAEEAKARQIVEYRQLEQRKRELAPAQGRMSLEQLFREIREGEVKELPVVLKADVGGSLEVLRDSVGKLATDKVKVNVLHSGVGAISTNDVLLASASKAIIVGFNVRPERIASDLAEKEQVDIRLHTVIYELLDELRKGMTGLLDPTFREVSKGRAEVRDIFRVPKVGTIAGCHVVEGSIPRSATVRLVRDGRVVHEGKIASLKRFKDDASEVRAGFDCGIGLDRFQDLKPGDIIEAYAKEEVAATL